MTARRSQLQLDRDYADIAFQAMDSDEESIEERLRRLHLPKPPPGAKDRGLKRFREYLDEHPELGAGDSEDGGSANRPQPDDDSGT